MCERNLYTLPRFIGAKHLNSTPHDPIDLLLSGLKWASRTGKNRKKCPLHFPRFPQFGHLMGDPFRLATVHGPADVTSGTPSYVPRRLRCSVLQYVTVCCSMLQCVAVCCSVLQCDVLGPAVVTSGNTRQKIATRCHVFCVDFIHMLAIYARDMSDCMCHLQACHVRHVTVTSHVRHNSLISKRCLHVM